MGGDGNDVVATLREPVQITLQSLQNPSLINQDATLEIGGMVSDAALLSYTLNFGDGNAASGTFAPGTTVDVPHTYTSYYDAGTTVTLVITDGITPQTTSLLQVVPSPASGADGVENILTGTTVQTPTVVPDGGLIVGVVYSNGGIVQLNVDVSALNDGTVDDYDISTEFTDPSAPSSTPSLGRAAIPAPQVIPGPKPIAVFKGVGISIATVTAAKKSRAGEGTVKKASLTIPVGAKDVGNSGDPAPMSTTVTTKTVAAKVNFPTTKHGNPPPDNIKYSGTFALPLGYIANKTHTLSFSFGNLSDKTTLNAAGTGYGALMKSVTVKTSLKPGVPAKAGATATISVTLSGDDLDEKGLDTAGISDLSSDLTTGGKASNPRVLQVAIVLDGQAYYSTVSTSLSVNTKSGTGTVTLPKK